MDLWQLAEMIQEIAEGNRGGRRRSFWETPASYSPPSCIAYREDAPARLQEAAGRRHEDADSKLGPLIPGLKKLAREHPERFPEVLRILLSDEIWTRENPEGVKEAEALLLRFDWLPNLPASELKPTQPPGAA